MTSKGIRRKVLIAAGVLALVAPGVAAAHLERPSYWPDPAPDTSVTPPAGGAVPKARSLAVRRRPRKGPGKVRVVCQGRGGRNSLRQAKRVDPLGAQDRLPAPPEPADVRYSQAGAARMRGSTGGCARSAGSTSIQQAVNASGNNDRVVIMPGLYTEPESRAAPLNDPRCNPSLLQNDASGDPDAELRVPGRPARTTRTWSTCRAARSRASRSDTPRDEPAGHPEAGARRRACAATSRSRAAAPSPTT